MIQMCKYNKNSQKEKKSWRVYTSSLRNGKQIISAHLKSNCKNIYVPALHDDAN